MDTIGKNITNTKTSDIQKNLGITVDDKYGPETTNAVKSFQKANNLTVDGIFGPETEATYTSKFNSPSSKLITTSTESRKDFTNNSIALNNALKMYNIDTTKKEEPKKTAEDVYKEAGIKETAGTETDPYMKQLDALAERSSEATKALIGNIKAKSQQQRESVNEMYNNYTAGLQLLGIQTNASRVTPDIVASHITQAKGEQLKKLNELDSEESTALLEAETARDNNDFKTLKAKMDYVKEIRNEKVAALKEYNDSLKENNDQAVKNSETAKAIAYDVYDTMQTLNDADKEDFLIALANEYKLPVLSIVSALTGVETERSKSDKGDDLLSPTEAATLGVPYGTTKADASKMGITPARYKPETSKTTKTDQIKEATNEITSALKTGIDADGNKIGNAKGEDGYSDPSVYIKYFNAWPGTDKEFLAKFPVKTHINPKSYDILPESIRPLSKREK